MWFFWIESIAVYKTEYRDIFVSDCLQHHEYYTKSCEQCCSDLYYYVTIKEHSSGAACCTGEFNKYIIDVSAWWATMKKYLIFLYS